MTPTDTLARLLKPYEKQTSIDLELIRIGSDASYAPCQFNAAVTLYVFRGFGKVKLDDGVHTLRPRTAVRVPAGTVVSFCDVELELLLLWLSE